MKNFTHLVLALCLLTPALSRAGLLIDPYIGLASTKTTFDDVTNAVEDEEATSTSTGIGARVGYSFFLVSAGLDYSLGTGDTALTNTSLFVGVDLPILLRFWGEYFLSSDVSDDDLDDLDVDLNFKNGYGLGVGFTGLPFLSINLEVEALIYDAEIGSTEGEMAIANTMLSVSFPLNL